MNIRNLKDQPLDEIQVKKAGRQIKGFLIWLLKVVIIVGISYNDHHLKQPDQKTLDLAA